MQGNREMKRAKWNWVGWLGESIFNAAFIFLYAAWYASAQRREIRRALAEGAALLRDALTPSLSGSRFEPAAALRLVVAIALVLAPVYPTTASASDIRAKLNSADGSTSFQVRDSNDAVVGSVDSKGNLIVVGSGTVTNTLTVSSNAYVTGNIGIGTAQNNGYLHIRAPNDQLLLEDSDGAVDAKKFLVKSDANALTVLTSNDAYSSFATAMQINRSGVTVNNVIFPNGSVGVGTGSPNGYFQVGPGTLTVLQNGNVGIGTTGPGSRLYVNGDAGMDNGIQVNMGAVANLRLSRSDSPAQTFILRTDNDSKFKIIDETASGAPKRLTIDTLGSIGVGTEFPWARLHVSSGAGGTGPQFIVSTGTAKLFEVDGSSIALGVPLFFPDGTSMTTAGGGSSHWTPSGNDIYNNNIGNVGVGTNAPGSKLDVFNGSVTVRGTNSGLLVGASNFVVTPSGQVGIGTTNPAETVTVAVSSPVLALYNNTNPAVVGQGGELMFNDMASGGGEYPYASVRGSVVNIGAFPALFHGALIFKTRSGCPGGAVGCADLYERMRINYDGNVGVGTDAPAYGLDLWGVFRSTSSAYLATSGGNVGIGTAGPSSKLEISGGSVTVRGTNAGLIVGTSQFVSVPGSGLTGIGTDTPGGRLHTFSDSGGNTGVGVQLLVSTGASGVMTHLFEVTGTSITLGLPLFFPDGTSMTTAGGAGGGQWTASGSDIYNNNFATGNVGVGTNSPLLGMFQVGQGSFTVLATGEVGVGTGVPEARLHTFSDPSAGGNTGVGIQLLVSTGTFGSDTHLFEVTGTSITLGLPLFFPDGTSMTTAGGAGGGQWTANGSDIYNNNYNTGNVGVGTQTPSSRFDVADGSVTIRGTNLGLAVGASYFYLNTAGSVGIGTANPLAHFHTFGAAGGNTGVGIQLLVSTGTAVSRTDLFEVTGTSVVAGVDAFKPGGGSWSTLSDIRLKKNIRTLDDALGKIERLRGVNFEWKDPGKDGRLPGIQTGMIAQEVEKVFPEWVNTNPAGYKYLTFRGFEAVATEAIKELKADVDRKQQEIDLLIKKHDQELAEQRREIEELKAIIRKRGRGK